MASVEQVRGYLLEETLAWLLRNNGYRLVTAPIPGDPALTSTGAGLTVRGRGACHQADVLGEFPYVPPFSLPIRMFVEAKSLKATDPVDLRVVRNAWATVADVNEFDVGANPYGYRYVYTLFSTSGFTSEAVTFALTHQISLVDLTLPMYATLRAAAEETADAVHLDVVGNGTVSRLRQTARYVLGTADVAAPPPSAGHYRLMDALVRMRTNLEAGFGNEMLLAFPPAPFVLALTGDIEPFLAHVTRERDHQIYVFRDEEDQTATGWVIRPADEEPFYTLRFSMPAHVDDWLTADRRHARQLKQTSLATIMIYRERDGIPTAYQLRFEPRPRTAREAL